MQEPVSTPNTPTRRPRRSYSKEVKRQIVARCEAGDSSIAQIALEHQIKCEDGLIDG